jgi:uncharacterized membrane protein
LLALSVVGLLDAIYLTWIKLSDANLICTGVGGCDVVNTSEYSLLAGLPIALFGAIAYVIFIILLLYESRYEWILENGPLVLFGLSLFGFLYSVYLTYIELFVIFAICPYCVLSAIIMTMILALAWIRLRQSWSKI